MRVECEVVEATVGEAVAIICASSAVSDIYWWSMANCISNVVGSKRIHFAFLTLAIRPTFARLDIDL